MDLLMECASVFKNLMNYQYRFTLGRKGKLKVITLGFSETDFHHLVGLHKLRDTEVARANRGAVFRAILSGRITYATIIKSTFIEEILSRLQTFPNLEFLLDHDQLVFRYNKKVYPYSSIESEFLLKMGDGSILDITFLFLDKTEQGIYYCRSFFPMERTDYTKEQMQYTLLKKEKIDIRSGVAAVQYERLTPKNK